MAADRLEQPTRLLLSDLAPSVTTALLKEHVLQGPVAPAVLTDVKVLLKSDGTSRRLAFVGCKRHKDAAELKQWLNGTWVQGTGGGGRIKVDWAQNTHDAPRPRKRAKLSPQPRQTQSQSTSDAHSPDQISRFAEFLSVMQPRRNRAVEELDVGQGSEQSHQGSLVTPAAAETEEGNLAEQVVSQLDRVPLSSAPSPQQVAATDDGVAQDDSISDRDYMAKRMKRTLDIVDPQASSWSQDEGSRAPNQLANTNSGEHQQTQDPTHQLLLESGRLFCRNLAYSATEDDLRELFEPYGLIDQVHIPLDKSTQSSKGMAYVTFRMPEHAVAAFDNLDGRTFQGRLLHLLPASGRRKLDTYATAVTLKSSRSAEKKRAAGDSINWSTLYMNSDAVLSSVASRLGVSKADLLDPSSSNASVRAALAETHVIAETKKYFQDEGIDLGAFGRSGARSSTAILVKNLPFGTTAATLRALFEEYGSIARLLVAPSGTMAIVDMSQASDASDAWRGLVYKKIGSSVLFLERAPANLWAASANVQEAAQTEAELAATVAHPVPSKTQRAQSDTPTAPDGSTLFVKNLSFSTTNDALVRAFSALPDFVFARVQTKSNLKDPSRPLSMGFGFVGFRTPASAAAGLQARDGFVLDGHKLEIRFAQRGKEEGVKTATQGSESKGNSTKLVIKNVPFEVSRQDIKELVSAYGQVKSVRLPRKFDRKTRGFAFLDFATHRDAETALAALKHTHLLGRHLVIQWAEEDDRDIEELRAKSVSAAGKLPVQKSKFAMS